MERRVFAILAAALGLALLLCGCGERAAGVQTQPPDDPENLISDLNAEI